MELFRCTNCGEVVDIESDDIYYDGSEDIFCLSCHFYEDNEDEF